MLVTDKKFWEKIVKNAEGYIYNDFGTQFPGDSSSWNTRNFNKLHKATCDEIKKMTYISEGKLTKHFFKSVNEAIKWLNENRGAKNYTLCTKCNPEL